MGSFIFFFFFKLMATGLAFCSYITGKPSCVFCRATITTNACKLWSSWPRCLVRRIQSSLHRTNLSGSATLGGTAHAPHIQLPASFSIQTDKHFNSKTKLNDFSHLCFLRFNDIHVPVRLECVKFASHCLMNHPDLAKDLTGTNCSQTNFHWSFYFTNEHKSQHEAEMEPL